MPRDSAKDTLRLNPSPCLKGLTRLGGALFTDLPANVAGSFFMGLFASTATLAAAYPGSGVGVSSDPAAALAMLPTRGPLAPLQSHSALHLGLRTGFCGSLTTFASWMLQMVEMFVGGRPSLLGSEWVAALWGLFINIAVSMTALVIGQHAAIALHAHWEQSAKPPERPSLGKTEARDTEDVRLPSEATSHVKEEQVVVSLGQQDPRSDAPSPSEGKEVGFTPVCIAVDVFVLVVLLFLTAISIGYATIDGKTPQASY